MENQHFRERIVFFDEGSFLLQGAVIKQNCGIWGLQLSNIAYESAKSFSTLKSCLFIFESDVRGPYFLTMVLLPKMGTNGCYGIICFASLPTAIPK